MNYTMTVDISNMAGSILDAWSQRDEGALQRELAKALGPNATAHRSALEEEHGELLTALAGRLDDRSARVTSSSMMRVCVGLLNHLAGHSTARPSA